MGFLLVLYLFVQRMISVSSTDARPLSRLQHMISNLFGFKHQSQPKIRTQPNLLPPPNQLPGQCKKTLVLDLDETLIHSSLVPVTNTDLTFSLELEGQNVTVYVSKRPGVDQFLQALKDKFELVVFTASIPQYADAILDFIDKEKTISSRLYRDSCTVLNDVYVKDLGSLGRDLKDTVIIDNTPGSFMLQPENGIGVTSWIDNQQDTELTDLLPLLESMTECGDVRTQISEMEWEAGDVDDIFL
ncbi:NLI interacting factor [Pelomyxa schiedti]|nr:NLI interacting factor [Pelomyxa schiedti]